MAYKPKVAGRVTLTAAETVVGVVLETSILQNTVKVRPTNTTATMNVIAGTGAITQSERDADKIILLHNGPSGGFTQQARLAAGTFLVNDVVAGVVTSITT